MRIETKFNIKDSIWVISENKICHKLILKINIRVEGDYTIIKYVTYTNSTPYSEQEFPQSACFPTKKDLVESLLNN